MSQILTTTIHPIGCAPTPLQYTIVYVRYLGQWLHVRHRDRATRECPGGHIEPGETPLQCAQRECCEEAGIRSATWIACFDYYVQDVATSASGRLFLAQVDALDEIPKAFEMAERKLFSDPPEHLTYPLIYNTLFPHVQRIKEEQSIP